MLQFSDVVVAPRVSDDILLQRLALANAVIIALLEQDVPTRLLRCIFGALKV